MHIMCCCEIILYKSICIVYNMASWQSFTELEKITKKEKILPTSSQLTLCFSLFSGPKIRHFNIEASIEKKI